MKDLYQEILSDLSLGREVILATLIHQKGSTPRSQGTQFLIKSDGTFIGTIGGGRLEAEVLQSAPSVFKEKTTRLLSFRLKGEEVAETEMICGGEVDVYLEPFSGSNRSDLELFQKISEIRSQGRVAFLATLIGEKFPMDRSNRKVLLQSDPQGLPDTPPWLTLLFQRFPGLLKNHQNRPWAVLKTPSEETVLLERLSSPPHLYIFGAGHISLFLCPLCKTVGFQVTLFDDRAEFANRERFPDADEIEVRPFEGLLADYTFEPEAYLVILTRGHLYDYQIIRKVLGLNHRYIGMIGSRHKRKVVFKALADEGFSEDRISRIHSPIGLDINAETPEEIAVSITAELIQVRGAGRKKL